jgi:hypothetical protein
MTNAFKFFVNVIILMINITNIYINFFLNFKFCKNNEISKVGKSRGFC